jgi:F0F1-type ATP synthase assembly protein I
MTPTSGDQGRTPPPGPKPSRGDTAPTGAQFAGAGLQFAVAIVAFMFLGIWLDKRLGSSPWFVLVCVFLGAGAGFYSIYRKLTGDKRG